MQKAHKSSPEMTSIFYTKNGGDEFILLIHSSSWVCLVRMIMFNDPVTAHASGEAKNAVVHPTPICTIGVNNVFRIKVKKMLNST